MTDKFEFNAPHYVDFSNPLTTASVCEDVDYFLEEGGSSSKSDMNYKLSNQRTPLTKTPCSKVTTPSGSSSKSDMNYKLSNQRTPLTKTPCSKVTTPNIISDSKRSQELRVRQSPRLAVAAKGLLVKTKVKSNRSTNHRRSLSESAIIPSKLSKVKKPILNKRSSRLASISSLENDDKARLKSSIPFNKSEHTRSLRAREFHFTTDARVDNKCRTNINDELVRDFASTLRSDRSDIINLNKKESQKGPTKIKAFKLHESKKPKEESQRFVSMAELNRNFITKTPQRFRSKRGHSVEIPDLGPKKGRTETGVTIAHTPQLSTRLRSRPAPQYPTREEIEERELEEAHKNNFKAQPLNKKIFEAPKLDLRERKKSVTIPQPFDITDSKKELNDLVGKKLLATCQSMVDSNLSLASIPHGGIPANWNKKSTLVKPFSFDSRDFELLVKKKQKIMKMIEEEKKLAQFHAQLMPIFDNVTGLPKKKTTSPTKVCPFNLRSDSRGMTKQEHLQKQLEELEKMEEEQRKFHAQPDSVIHKQPFIPEKSKKPLTDISGFSLNTERRAEERFSFDVHLKQKEDEMMAKKREDEERQKAEEEAEVARLRKEVVHKAQPVPRYKPFQVKSGLLPPTMPISPDFATDSRLRSRTSSKQNLNSTSSFNSTFNKN